MWKLFLKTPFFLALFFATFSTFAGDVNHKDIEWDQSKTRFIAVTAGPEETSGSDAESWGYWRQDPGPRGVWLHLYPVLRAAGGYGPFGWKFDPSDWWVDENGLIMEKPEFPVPPGVYRVTGAREKTSILTVFEKDADGKQRWELAPGATIFDVTHLGCRSARYTPIPGKEASCTPSYINKARFKIGPGEPMPKVAGCTMRDYAVLIVTGVAK